MTYKQETIKPYSQEGEKGKQVEQMFDNIAHSYDLLNHLLSFGIDRHWRRAALEMLKPHAPKKLLDMATGTGDFALEAMKIVGLDELLGADLSEGMLEVARHKAQGIKGIRFEKHDCMNLKLEDNSFDAVTVAYGVRNFPDLERGLRELLRVLRPGGHLVIIELTSPRKFPMKQLFWLYSHLLMPLIGKLVSRDANAYTYLPATMEAFPQGEIMQGILEKTGYCEVSFKRFTFGLSTMYFATKPQAV